MENPYYRCYNIIMISEVYNKKKKAVFLSKTAFFHTQQNNKKVITPQA